MVAAGVHRGANDPAVRWSGAARADVLRRGRRVPAIGFQSERPVAGFPAVNENCIRLWNVSSGRPGPLLATADDQRRLRIAWSAEGKSLASMDHVGFVVIFQSDGNSQSLQIAGYGWPRCPGARTGKWIAATFSGRMIGVRLVEPDGPLGPSLDCPRAMAIGFSPDGRYLAAREPGDDRYVAVWNTATWKRSGCFPRRARSTA